MTDQYNSSNNLPATKQKQCSSCGTPFGCTNTEGNGKCWCDNYPPLYPINPAADCFCPDCLEKALAQMEEKNKQ